MYGILVMIGLLEQNYSVATIITNETLVLCNKRKKEKALGSAKGFQEKGEI